MKTLQNSHTTPEQSKRLLELGVPAWTADCYYYEEGNVCNDSTPQVVPFGEVWTDESTETLFSSYVDMPCWSGTRLMEIYNICKPDGLVPDIRFGRYENMMHIIIDAYVYMQGRLDFSKLEE